MMDHADRRSEPSIILDLSRLLSRITHVTPTGVDRCELAYARGLLETVPERLEFAAVHPTGIYGRIAKKDALSFLKETEQRWESGGFASRGEKRRFIVKSLMTMRPRRIPASAGRKDAIYLQASPNNLAKPKLIASILRRENARFICLIHDLIPLEFPEYARSNGAAQHRQRMETVAQLASGIITNSDATRASLAPWLDGAPNRPLIRTALLGTPPFKAASPRSEERPFFLCIGTIEPRKNHLLLLHLWRQMAEAHGPLNIPKLLIVGRRGWENEQIVDMLERCNFLAGCVEEHTALPDRLVRELMASARALLLPSFAEGYGIPIAEALAAKLPVICSALPALIEAGSKVPEYLDPLDGPAWREAIIDYASPTSARRLAQLKRLESWHRPTWQQHIDILLMLIRDVATNKE